MPSWLTLEPHMDKPPVCPPMTGESRKGRTESGEWVRGAAARRATPEYGRVAGSDQPRPLWPTSQVVWGCGPEGGPCAGGVRCCAPLGHQNGAHSSSNSLVTAPEVAPCLCQREGIRNEADGWEAWGLFTSALERSLESPPHRMVVETSSTAP